LERHGIQLVINIHNERKAYSSLIKVLWVIGGFRTYHTAKTAITVTPSLANPVILWKGIPLHNHWLLL